ncbi:DUF2066 domain-containing protein [Taklimakanibacter deserti]|uniref:DUF2066 domain-containing protein n=1 Tax=Taklimakanibacter deserti TaxID=2267839 RepID=UPI0013C4A1AC
MNRIISVLFLVVLACGAVFAAEPSDLYRGRTIVTGIKDDTRIPAAPICLLDVLAKISGDARLLDDPRAREIAAAATFHATEYSYRDRYALRQIHDEQGTRDRPYYLTVTFDPQRVDAALESLGRKPWTANRPNLALFLVVNNNANTYVLSGDGTFGRDQRESLAAASWLVGMPVTLPSEADLAKEGLTADVLSTIQPAKLDMVTKGMGADLVLLGSLVWNKGTLGWAAEWKLFDGKEISVWKVKDVNFDEAFRNALRGSALILSGNGKPD